MNTTNTQLFKAPNNVSKNAIKRVPVLLHKDGSIERIRLTPYRGGLLTASGNRPLLFGTGKWKSDAGYPKLRWTDAMTVKQLK